MFDYAYFVQAPGSFGPDAHFALNPVELGGNWTWRDVCYFKFGDFDEELASETYQMLTNYFRKRYQRFLPDFGQLSFFRKTVGHAELPKSLGWVLKTAVATAIENSSLNNNVRIAQVTDVGTKKKKLKKEWFEVTPHGRVADVSEYLSSLPTPVGGGAHQVSSVPELQVIVTRVLEKLNGGVPVHPPVCVNELINPFLGGVSALPTG